MTCLMLKPWVEHFRSRNWPTRDVTNATLLTHTWPTARGQRTETSCRFEIALDRYSLQVTQRLAFGIDRCEHARSAWVNPDDPHDAVIHRDLSPILFLMLQLLGLSWLVLSVGVLFDVPGKEAALSPSLGDEDGVSRARQRARALKAFLSPKDGHGLAVQ